MRLEVSLSPALYPFRTITSSHITVAIDVLRATSAVCAAFQAGCNTVVPLDTLEGISRYRNHGYLIAAERGGKKVDGAEYGNSPTEYLRHDMHGVKLAYSTTNGTISILRGADADLTLVGAFANLAALCDRLQCENKDTVLLCSGWQNDFCIEDTLVAGAIVERLQGVGEVCGDAANMALDLWRMAKGDPYGYCHRCTHVHRLEGFGAQADIEFAFRQDTCPVVPILRNGELTLDR